VGTLQGVSPFQAGRHPARTGDLGRTRTKQLAHSRSGRVPQPRVAVRRSWLGQANQPVCLQHTAAESGL